MDTRLRSVHFFQIAGSSLYLNHRAQSFHMSLSVAPSSEVRAEIETLLRADARQIGLVFRQIEAGVNDDTDIVAAGAAKNT